MAIGRNMFRLPKTQRHEYKPRFWDPKKEDLERRISSHDRLRDNDPEAIKEGIRGAFRRGGRGGSGDYFAAAKMRQEQTRRSNMIILSIIIVLVALSYIILSVYLPAL